MIANPSRPNAQFDPFFTAVVKEIGAALELPLEELLLHYSSSYSAARAAMLQAWRFYSLRRWWLACDFCQPSRELIIDEAVARGLIDLPGYSDPSKRKAYCQAIWIGPARGAIDELKEANAAGKRIEIGVSNETLETAAMTGEPWQQVIRQRTREVTYRREHNIQALPKGGLESRPDPNPKEE
ncbi:Phage portal protein, lambda family [compost metagenome]